jgi:hypothetical protein
MRIIKLFVVYTIIMMSIQWSIPARAEVNIYDAPSRPGWIVIEAIDDCNYSHKLLIKLELADSYRPSDWLELLMISGEWNKCLTKGM